jgi:hypothetical protein
VRRVLLGLGPLLVLLPAPAQTLPASPHTHEPFVVPEADRVVVARFAEALRLSERLREVLWPGFSLGALPIAVFRPGGAAYVAGHPSPPHAFRELAAAGAEGGARIRFAPATAEMRSNATLRIDGLLFSTLEARGLEPPSLPEDSVGLVFHEGFHNFAQRTASRSGAESPNDGAGFPDLDPRGNALAVLEGALLGEALGAKDEASARERASEFLAVRAERAASLGAAFAAWEEGVEWNEGLATYAETRAVLLAGGLERDAATRPADPGIGRYPAPEEYRARRFAELASPGRIPDRSRARLYLTGAAQAILLDRISPDWKEEAFAKGTSPSRLLASGLRFDAAAAPGLAEKVAKRFSFDAILANEARTAREAGEKRRAEAEAALARGDGELRIEAGDAGAPEVLLLDPPSVRRVDAERLFHARVLRIRFPGRGSASFERPVLADPAHASYRIALDLSAFRLAVNGEEVALAGEPRALGRGEVRLTSPGITVEGRDVEVSSGAEGDRRLLVVRFLPPAGPK